MIYKVKYNVTNYDTVESSNIVTFTFDLSIYDESNNKVDFVLGGGNRISVEKGNSNGVWLLEDNKIRVQSDNEFTQFGIVINYNSSEGAFDTTIRPYYRYVEGEILAPDCEVEIDTQNNQNAKPLNPEITDNSEVLTLGGEMGTLTYEGNGLFDNIKPCTLTFDVISNNETPWDLYTSGDDITLILQSENKTLNVFYLRPNVFNSDYSAGVQETQTEWEDALSHLQYKKFIYSGNTYKSFYSYFKDAFKLIDYRNIIKGVVIQKSVQDVLDITKCGVSTRNFIDEDENALSYEEVIDAICGYLDVQCYTYGNLGGLESGVYVYLVEKANKARNSEFVCIKFADDTTRTVTINTEFTHKVGNANPTVSIGEVYNQKSIIARTNTIDDVIPDVFTTSGWVQATDIIKEVYNADAQNNEDKTTMLAVVFNDKTTYVNGFATLQLDEYYKTIAHYVRYAEWKGTQDVANPQWKNAIEFFGQQGGYISLVKPTYFIGQGGMLILGLSYRMLSNSPYSKFVFPHSGVAQDQLMYDEGRQEWHVAKLKIGEYTYTEKWGWVNEAFLQQKRQLGIFDYVSNQMDGALQGWGATRGTWWKYRKDDNSDWMYCANETVWRNVNSSYQKKTGWSWLKQQNTHSQCLGLTSTSEYYYVDYERYNDYLIGEGFRLIHTAKQDESVFGATHTIDNNVSYTQNVTDAQEGFGIKLPTNFILQGQISFQLYACPLSGSTMIWCDTYSNGSRDYHIHGSGDSELSQGMPSTEMWYGSYAGVNSSFSPYSTLAHFFHGEAIDDVSLIYRTYNKQEDILGLKDVVADTVYKGEIENGRIVEDKDIELKVNTCNDTVTSYSFVLQEVGNGGYTYKREVADGMIQEERILKKVVNYNKKPRKIYNNTLQGDILPFGICDIPTLESDNAGFGVSSITYNLGAGTCNVTLNELTSDDGQITVDTDIQPHVNYAKGFTSYNRTPSSFKSAYKINVESSTVGGSSNDMSSNAKPTIPFERYFELGENSRGVELVNYEIADGKVKGTLKITLSGFDETSTYDPTKLNAQFSVDGVVLIIGGVGNLISFDVPFDNNEDYNKMSFDIVLSYDGQGETDEPTNPDSNTVVYFDWHGMTLNSRYTFKMDDFNGGYINLPCGIESYDFGVDLTTYNQWYFDVGVYATQPNGKGTHWYWVGGHRVSSNPEVIKIHINAQQPEPYKDEGYVPSAPSDGRITYRLVWNGGLGEDNFPEFGTYVSIYVRNKTLTPVVSRSWWVYLGDRYCNHSWQEDEVYDVWNEYWEYDFRQENDILYLTARPELSQEIYIVWGCDNTDNGVFNIKTNNNYQQQIKYLQAYTVIKKASFGGISDVIDSKGNHYNFRLVENTKLDDYSDAPRLGTVLYID